MTSETDEPLTDKQPENIRLEPEELDDYMDYPMLILSFCLPAVGFGVYWDHRKRFPKRAKRIFYTSLAGMAAALSLYFYF